MPRFFILATASLLLATTCARGDDLPKVSDEAIDTIMIKTIVPYVGKHLKNPRGAKYGVKSITKLDADKVLAPDCFSINGDVEFADTTTSSLNVTWVAHARRIDGNLVVLKLGITGADPEPKTLFKSEAKLRYNDELVKKVNEDFKASQEKPAKQAEKLPVKRRKEFLQKSALQFVQKGKTYGLTIAQMNDILGLEKK